MKHAKIVFGAILFGALSLGALSLMSIRSYAQSTTVDDTSLRARIEANVKSYPFTLAEDQKQSLSAKCFPLQEKLRVIRDNLIVREQSRDGAFRRIEARLSVLQKRFDAQGVDTSIIDLLLANYRKDLALYTNAVTQQEVSMNDTVVMDCANNPEQMRSQIEAIRANHNKTVEEIERITTFLQTNILESLESIKEKAE